MSRDRKYVHITAQPAVLSASCSTSWPADLANTSEYVLEVYHFYGENTEVGQHMNSIRKPLCITNKQAFANEMNDFYRRLETTRDSSRRCVCVLSDVFLGRTAIGIDVDDVPKSFK